jgi:hypothetical protein
LSAIRFSLHIGGSISAIINLHLAEKFMSCAYSIRLLGTLHTHTKKRTTSQRSTRHGGLGEKSNYKKHRAQINAAVNFGKLVECPPKELCGNALQQRTKKIVEREKQSNRGRAIKFGLTSGNDVIWSGFSGLIM